jgi:SRSO17 transposase
LHYFGTFNLYAHSHLSTMQSGTAFTLPRDIDADLDHWLEPFLDVTGRSTRREMAPLYVRGLLGSGGRKSVQPMAERLGLASHDPLHHFITSPAWDDAPLWRVLAEQVDREVGGEDAVLVVDESGIPKKGELSVGVARQYCGEVGKVANSQVLVTLTLARGEVPLPVGLRLFLPTAWTDDPERCEEAGVPEAARTAQTKPEIALAEIERVRAAGLRFSCVLADAGFGSSPDFRHGLDERELAWAAGIACTQLVYPTTVKLCPAYTPSGRPAKHPIPNRPPRSAAEMLETQRWRRITWRNGTKGPLNARFAAVRVRVADGPLNAENTRLPGEELWLIGEWRDSGEKKYYLSNLPKRTSLRRLAASVKARWSCEQVHQQLKQELGLGDFEGRSWTGLHRHALMTCIAFAYLQHRRLKAAGRGKKVAPGGPPPQPSLPEIRRAIIAKLFAPPAVPYRCPHCHRRILQHAFKVPK